MKKYIVLIILIITPISLISRDCLEDAFKHYENQEYNKSLKGMVSCLADIEDDADPVEMAYAYFGIASSYLKLGQIDSSLKYTLIAYNIETTNNLPISKTLNQLGNLYINKGLNHQAIYYLKKAVEINTIDYNESYLQKNFNNLGIANQEIGLIDSSVYFYKLSLSLTKDGDSENNLIMNNLASLYFSKNNITKSNKILDEITDNYLSSNTKVERYLILSNKVLFKLLTTQSITVNELSMLKDYLEFCKSRNDFYSADANSKLSIYTLLNGNIEEAIDYLNRANETYVSVGNIGLAKEITSRFSKLMRSSEHKPFKYSVDELNEKQIQLYSSSLSSEIETKLNAENYITDLNSRLNRAELSFYITLSLLISILLTFVVAIQKIRSSKKIQQIINGYVSYLNIISQLDSNRLRNNLSKINNYMVLDESFNNKKYFTELVDEVVRDTNNIRKTVKEGIIFQQTKRLKDVNVITTN